MSNSIIVKKKINNFNKKITVTGDKSISIRWVLFSSMANGMSTAHNLLISDDVLAALNAVNKLGIKTKITKKDCTIYGKGIDGFNYKKKFNN